MSNGQSRVCLLAVPVEPFVRGQLHVDELLHELQLLQAGADAGTASPPQGLRELMDEILSEYAEARQTALAQAELARSQGRDRFDLELALPSDAAVAARRLLSLLEQADEYCRAQRLLTVEAAPDVVALRRWITEEMEAQLKASAAPTPCPL